MTISTWHDVLGILSNAPEDAAAPRRDDYWKMLEPFRPALPLLEPKPKRRAVDPMHVRGIPQLPDALVGVLVERARRARFATRPVCLRPSRFGALDQKLAQA